MPIDTNVLRGRVHGRTIDLEEDMGLPDGQEVTVTVEPVKVDDLQPLRGEGLRRAFGGWAEDADELDEYLEWNRMQRKQGVRGLRRVATV